MTSGGRSHIVYLVEGIVLVGVVPFLAMYMIVSAILVMASMVVLNIVIGLTTDVPDPVPENYNQQIAQNSATSSEVHDGEPKARYYHVTPMVSSGDTSSR